MFQVFWDESGTHAKELMILAGFVGTGEKWLVFTEAWQSTLKEYGVTHIHMKDFNSYTSGVFKGLDWFQRTALYCELLAIIKRTISIGFVCTVHQSEFNAIVPEHFRSQHIGTPYTFLTQTGVEVVSEWAKGIGCNDPIAHMFEDGVHTKQAYQHLHEVNQDLALKKKYLLGPYAFERKESFPALQAADVLAWTSYGGELDRSNKTVLLDAKKRGPLHAFGIETEWKHCEPHYLTAMVKEATHARQRARRDKSQRKASKAE